jgi:hypothetical protein
MRRDPSSGLRPPSPARGEGDHHQLSSLDSYKSAETTKASQNAAARPSLLAGEDGRRPDEGSSPLLRDRAWGLRRLGIAALAISGFALAAQAAERALTGPEITPYLSGRSISGLQGSQRWTQTFLADGTTTFVMGRPSDPGTWTVKDDAYCSRWGSNLTWSCWRVLVDGEAVTFQSLTNPSDVWPGQRQPQ